MHYLSRACVGLAGAALLCSSLWCGSPALGQEWTRFRGPNGTGVSDAKTVPAEWTPEAINWKVKLPGAGHSSPVLWGDKIFLTGAENNTTALRVAFCLNAADGSLAWSRSYPSKLHKRHEFNSFASATPAVDEERVYVVWSTPDEYSLIALTHDNEEVWRKDLGPFISQHSCGTSPIIYENLIILGNEQDAKSEQDPDVKGVSFLIAVDRRTGETVWQVPRESKIVPYSTPAIYHAPGGGPAELLFNSTAHGITSLDPLTGKFNWEVGGLLDKRSCSSPVLLSSGLITASCGSGGGGNYIVAVKPATKAAPNSGSVAYKFDKGAPYVPTPLAKGDMLFLWSDGGVVSCLDAASGDLHWQRRVGGNYFGSPVCVDDRLFCVSTEGDVVVVAAKKEYELLAKNPLGEVCHSTPAVAGGRMYVRTYEHLTSVGGK